MVNYNNIKYDEKRNKGHSGEMEQKVNKLYQLITEWDSTCANVPSIVKRLHTLYKLHEQGVLFMQR